MLIGDDITTWLTVSHPMSFAWLNPGGDWSGRDGAYGSEPFSAISVALGEIRVMKEFDVTEIMRSGDSFMLRRIGGDKSYSTARLNLLSAVLAVDGDLYPLLCATSIAPTAGTPIGRIDQAQLPCLFRASVPEGFKSAVLRIEVASTYYGRTDIGAFMLQPPLPNVNPQGDDWPSNLTTIFESDFQSIEQMNSKGWGNAAVLEPQHITDPVFADGRLTIKVAKGSHVGSSFRKRLAFTADQYANGSNPAPSEIYTEWEIEFHEDIGTVDGVKLPGVHAMFENGPFPPGMESLAWYGSSLRTFHSKLDPVNPRLFGFETYMYGPGQAGSGSGSPLRVPGHLFTIEKGRKYRFGQHLKMNTVRAKGDYDADGVYELYVNRLKVWSGSAMVFRADPRVSIEDGLWVNIYHGGRSVADKDAHYTLSNVRISVP